MPLLKSLESPHGAYAEWWCVFSCSINHHTKTASVVLTGFVSKVAHAAGKEPLFEMAVKDAADVYQNLDVSNFCCSQPTLELAVKEVVEQFKRATYHPLDADEVTE